MANSLDDMDWLTRSENRVAVLEALQEGRQERSTLQELTGVSRVTSNRMLAALEERNWIIRDGHEYEITPTGRLVIEDLNRLLDTTETAEKLGDIQRYLPTEEFDFDLRRFKDATVVYPSQYDTMAPLKRSAEIVAAACSVRVIGDAYDPIHMRTIRDHWIENPESRSIEAIFPGDALEAVRADAVMSRCFREMSEVGDVSPYRYDEGLVYALTIADELVILELYDGRGFVPAIVTSDDPEVLACAEATFERCKHESEPLKSHAFTE